MKKTKKKATSSELEKIQAIQKRCIESFEFFCQFLTIKGFDLTKGPSESVSKENQPFFLKQHQKDFIQFLERKDVSECIVIKCRQIRNHGSVHCLLSLETSVWVQ
jgi:hypothetical protein